MLSEDVKDVVGYEGLYAVTRDGRVYSHSRVVNTCHGATRLMKGRWLKPAKDGGGYLFVGLCRDGDVKPKKIHRLVAEAFIENKDAKPYINHIDNNNQNNCADNLEWCTQHENMQHCSRSGRVKIPRHVGSEHPMSKLIDSDVRIIKNDVTTPISELAKRFNVTVQAIHAIKKGKTWRHVNG